MALLLSQSGVFAVESDQVFCDDLIAGILVLVLLKVLWIMIFTVWYIALLLVCGNAW
jgi:hypothetical protein